MTRAHTGSIEVVAADPGWPARFARERDAIVAAVTAAGERITVHHGGSTSVPGLDAKPTIDVFAEASGIAAADRIVRVLEAAGFTYRPEYETVLPTRRFLFLGERGTPDGRLVNLHLYAGGDPELHRHLAFRDWLCTHADARDAYARVKHEAAGDASDIDAYTGAKTAFVRGVERTALAAWGRAHPRIEHAVAVAADPAATWARVGTAPGLASWLCQRAERRGDELTIEVDDEYGYARRYRGRVELDEPQRALTVRWERIERTWDGQRAPGVAGLAGARWARPEHAPQLVTRIVLCPTVAPDGRSGTLVTVVEEGFQREEPLLGTHAAWWQYQLEVLADGLGGHIDGVVAVGPVPAPAPGRGGAWRAIAGDADAPPAWVGEGGSLDCAVGGVLVVRWPEQQDDADDVAWGTVERVRTGRELRVTLRPSGGHWLQMVTLAAGADGITATIRGITGADAEAARSVAERAKAAWIYLLGRAAGA